VLLVANSKSQGKDRAFHCHGMGALGLLDLRHFCLIAKEWHTKRVSYHFLFSFFFGKDPVEHERLLDSVITKLAADESEHQRSSALARAHAARPGTVGPQNVHESH